MPFFTSSCLAMNSELPPSRDIGTAAGHVGGDRHLANAAGLRHDFGFTLVVLGIQHHVLDALLLQQIGEPLRLLDRRRAHQDRLPVLM